MRTLLKLGLGILTLAACSVLRELPAEACGGCFHEPPNPNETPSVVTDHRMAFSVSKTQTTLWDQVRYAGDPTEFAWVLPVRAGTVVQVARDEFLTALESATAPTIAPPQIQCFYPPSASGSGGGGGFGCSSSDTASFAPVSGSAADGGYSASDDGGVQIISQSVVGPYEAVVLRSSQGQAITDWLQAHNFAIPSSITPVLSYYSDLAFDFVAIRLRPNVGVRAMQPIRVVSPGADATLPLRMVAAGVGQKVGIELFVLSEGRYEATTFANALIDPATVKWDSANQRSTYTSLFTSVTDAATKGVWVTEYAGKGAALGLQSTYRSSCFAAPPVQVPCPVPDGGTTDAGGADAGDAGASDGGCFQMVPACDTFDDYDRATDGMNLGDITITRMRTNLPTTALTTDLVLGAAKSQDIVSNVIQTKEFVDPTYNPCPGGSTTPYSNDHGDGCDSSGSHGEVTLSALAMLGLGLAGVGRRLRRRR